MAAPRIARWILWTTGIFIGVVALLAVALHFATQALKGEVEKALGPHGEIGEIIVGLRAVEVINLRIKAASGWPADDELRAARVIIKPDLLSLLDRGIRISSIRIEDAYLSMLRRKDGKMLIVPSLLLQEEANAKDKDKKPKADDTASTLPKIQINQIILSNASVDFYDASIRKPPLKIALEQVNVEVGKVVIPDLTGHTPLAIDAIIKGLRHDGTLSVKGDIEIATKESKIQTRMRDVDLLTFQPYLIKAAETGVKKGQMSLDMQSTVKANRLKAPGTVTLVDLELSGGSSFMGMSRDTMVASMKDKSGRITVDFVLEGDINDPRFSLNEAFYTKLSTSLAGALGISLEGLAKGLGSTGSSTAKGVSDTLGKLFGK